MVSFRQTFFASAAVFLSAVNSVRNRLLRKPFEGVPNFTLIEDGLYLGGQCLRPPPDVRAVLSVTPVPDKYSVDYVEWQPISYGSLPTIAWLRRRMDFIDEHRRARHGVFVHCDAGADRSAFVMAAYLMWRDGVGCQDAIELLRRKRSVVKPNPALLELLGKWESHLLELKRQARV